MSADILKALGLGQTNSGTYLGNGEWSGTSPATDIEVFNPSNGEPLARVSSASEEVLRTREQSGAWLGSPPMWRITRGRLAPSTAALKRRPRDTRVKLAQQKTLPGRPEGPSLCFTLDRVLGPTDARAYASQWDGAYMASFEPADAPVTRTTTWSGAGTRATFSRGTSPPAGRRRRRVVEVVAGHG